MVQIINGREIARDIREKIRERVEQMPIKPKLAVILVGDDEASHLYVGLKQRACEEAGIGFELFLYPADASEPEIVSKIQELNARTEVTGILVQLPLPSQNADRVVLAIDPKKDVDGFHPANLENLKNDHPTLVSATALGIMKLITATNEELRGKQAVLVSGERFAEPLEILLAEQGVASEVVSPDDPHLKEKTQQGDILIVAVGRPHLINGEMIKNKAIVLDVGTNKIAERTIGDVDQESAAEAASWITPVPGGVGPMTVAMLLVNITKAWDLQK
ncbi:bifunctional 5,10-methylenetetrahydrofolate dehydrogenase/5,10-methenyltetrahydrofolate cyclohydrolase [Patescibacteria group bacterium]|nr:bifunctional 5,10-methylenetetrahydrofolate dehydrogenase/5,10-methenyltetrahydrofolate cyclohydrolase [Patescibacteria group bacterium]MBU1705913.1 bifunctional 5,10-methylenetetrahydrofolate dehydrogenase/5,10-methenyltetrahydrofolate cyclohydrolase [Patescibacteria group bacterium]